MFKPAWDSILSVDLVVGWKENVEDPLVRSVRCGKSNVTDANAIKAGRIGLKDGKSIAQRP